MVFDVSLVSVTFVAKGILLNDTANERLYAFDVKTYWILEDYRLGPLEGETRSNLWVPEDGQLINLAEGLEGDCKG